MATLSGRALLGWMSREDAVSFLLNDCVFDPPIDAIKAEAIWEEYRERAKAIPERPPEKPARLPLDEKEKYHAAKFLKALAAIGPHDVCEIIKIDLSKLAVTQFYVATTISNEYKSKVDGVGWLREALPLTTAPRMIPPYQVHRTGRNSLSTAADISIPDSEFHLWWDAKFGGFTVHSASRHVTAFQTPDRMYLRAGYHRSFAKISSVPAATVPVAAVALVAGTVTETGVSAAPPASAQALGLTPFGVRPALLSDFFVGENFMDVNLRRKHYELQVRSTWTAVNDP